MKINNKKINILFANRRISQGGIALLFSIMLSTIFLTIAIGVLNIAVKELNFSSSAKDTNNAFFAADSGVECALYGDKAEVNSFIPDSNEVRCLGTTASFSNKYTDDPSFQSFDFSIQYLGANGVSCVKVNVYKTFNTETEPPILSSTKITAKGYNFAGNEDCSDYSGFLNRVERVLEVNY